MSHGSRREEDRPINAQGMIICTHMHKLPSFSNGRLLKNAVFLAESVLFTAGYISFPFSLSTRAMHDWELLY